MEIEGNIYFSGEIERAREMADVHKMAVRREGSRNEGSEPRVELVNKHRVKAGAASTKFPSRRT